MIDQRIKCSSVHDLHKVAKVIVEHMPSSKIVVFRGKMGAGKTTLIKNMCTFLGVKDAVSSPTFSIVNEYVGEKEEAIYHFDFYRIEVEEEALDIGCEDYFYSDSICLIEWPEKVENLLPKVHLEVQISLQGEEREFKITSQN